MSVRRLRALSALAGLVLVSACQGSGSHGPNVVLISIDTLRADRLHCYGHERETSPAIDALSARGVLFERAFSHAPKTAPSHMSILTGLLPEAHGVDQLSEEEPRRLRPGIPTLASLLRRAGYRTVAITEGGNVAAALGFDEGFDRYASRQALPLATREALSELDRRAEDADGPPLFLFFHTYAVHDPYTPPEPYRSLFTNPDYAGRIESDAGSLEDEVGGEWRARHERFWSDVDRDDPEALRQLLDLYDGGVRWADAGIGRLLDRLESRGLMDETLIVLLSDHGEEFLEHDGFLHEQVYDETLHVPLILALPGPAGAALAGRRETAAVGLVDVLPTLLELLGIPAPARLDGRSLVPLLAGNPRTEAAILSGWARTGKHALRLGRWKLVRFSQGERPRRELYDVLADAGERRDLAGERAEVADRLERQLDSALARARAFARDGRPGARVATDARERGRLRALGYLE